MEPIFSFKHNKMKESLITIPGSRGTPLTLIVVVRSNLIFLSVFTGFPVSMHDSRVLKNFSLSHDAEEGNILSNPTDIIEKTTVGLVL